MEPPSARPWLGVGAALSALPAAGGCFCAALVLAVVADSDPGAVYEQHRWLGAIVAASAACAYVAMMGWATLRHGGLPAPVLLIALALSGVPFLLPGGLFLPAAALAVAGCAALATAGLRSPPPSSAGTRAIAAGLAAAAVVFALTQAVGVGLAGSGETPRADVLAQPAKPGGTEAAPAPAADNKAAPAPASAPAMPDDTASSPVPAGDALEGPVLAPAPDLAGPRRFVADYYAALDAHRFADAWRLLGPDVQRAFGGFEGWRDGYARTVSHAAENVSVAPAGTGATVGLTLRAGDRGACGRTVERRFAVTWRLARTDAGWRATAASARKLSGPEPC